MKKQLFKSHLLSLAALFGLMLALASCAHEDLTQKTTEADADNDKNLTTFTTGTSPETRTSMDYNTGAFYWEEGDHIYVQDDDNVWQKSSNAPTSKVAAFKFKVPGKFTAKTSYKVYYPGKNGNNNLVTIPAAQTQTAAHDTRHFGASGDCGVAKATKVEGKAQFEFKLDHQAAILVFQPYLGNDNKLVSTYVTKIEVTSNNNITGTYTLNSSTGALTGTGTGKQITLTTKSTSGTFSNGFPLTKKTPDLAANGAYMIIMPGMHTLTVKYTLKDVQTNVEGTITKTCSSFDYQKNTYYDMKANLAMTDYDATNYYMWDAKKQYWDGWEWIKNLSGGQPTLNNTSSTNYAQNNSDSRYYNTSNSPQATHSCASLPNVNEIAWYAVKGDPRWDGDKLWTTMRHLYKGGIWLKKKEYISNYNTEKAPDGIDYRIENYNTGWGISSTPPSVADADKYFYLPALGYYEKGKLEYLGHYGYYWSSNVCEFISSTAYRLVFHSGSRIGISYSYRDLGYSIGKFE